MNGVKQSNICCLEDVHQPEIRDLIATIRDHSKELSDMKDHPSISLVLKIIDHLEWVQCSSSKEVFLAIFMEVEEMVFSAAVQLQDYLVFLQLGCHKRVVFHQIEIVLQTNSYVKLLRFHHESCICGIRLFPGMAIRVSIGSCKNNC
eukprot:m.108670 g.108670  ORF g.108670 m.108670 type:complete len:147 (+) comp9192_c0_seq19:1185-1625(+)